MIKDLTRSKKIYGTVVQTSRILSDKTDEARYKKFYASGVQKPQFASSGPPPFDPSTYGTCKVWIDQTDPAYNFSDNLGTVPIITGHQILWSKNKKDLTVIDHISNSTSGPVYTAGVQGSIAGAVYAGSTSACLSGNFGASISNTYTVAVVAQRTGGTPASYPVAVSGGAGGGSSQDVFIYEDGTLGSSGQISASSGSSTDHAVSNWASMSIVIMEFVDPGTGSSTLQVNGTSDSHTVSATPARALPGLCLGMRGSFGLFPWIGSILHVFVFSNGIVTSGQSSAFAHALGTLLNITVSP